jgi:hypothetical protein
MVSRFREQVGTAGLIVAVVALVVALSGGAYAASGALTGKQKKEVEKIAKSVSKPGKTGAVGPGGAAGPAGPAGAKGDNGAAGATGGAGTAGAAGKEGAEGPEGPEGSPWTAGGTLPSGKTETGAWSVGTSLAKNFAIWEPISFTIPLASSVSVHFVNSVGEEIEEGVEEGPSTVCTGSAAAPTAAPGALCLYERTGSGGSGATALAYEKVENPEGTPAKAAGKVGVNVQFFAEGAGAVARGDWAVTAP